MTATRQREQLSASDVLTAVEALGPAIRARAPEVEKGRRVPRDLLDELVAAGCLRLLLPASHGGIEGDLPTATRVFEELARADASVGWIVALGASVWRDVAGLPVASFDAIYAGGPDTLLAGVFNPSGTLRDLPAGYRVDGRWSFASGCEHADWIYGNCIHEGAPPPGLRIAVFQRDDVVIEDTWDSLGMRGTGSHHFRADGVVVPRERTCPTLEGEPCVETPLLRIPAPTQFALEIAAIALGTARGAWDDVAALSSGKVPLLAYAPLAEDPTYHRELATSDTRIRAARALIHREADQLWQDASDGSAFTDERRARVRAAASWATAEAAAAVASAHRSAGSAGVYETGSLPRRLRDINTITQHFLVKPSTMTTAGALLAGQPIDVPVF